jgi:hypothetical protein
MKKRVKQILSKTTLLKIEIIRQLPENKLYNQKAN